jgi:CRISPR/Cas system CSM-associated protein Csm3 (group 7 of RAMP superfamily)
MMFGNRLHLRATVELLSDLHLGSGQSERKKVRERNGEEREAELAQVQRDHEGHPIIQATSLKGALRSAAEGLGDPVIHELFGEISAHEEGKGRIGRLWLDTACWHESQDALDFQGLAGNGRSRDDGFDQTHVRIDRQTGAAQHRLLFTEEMIGRGACFGFQSTWLLGRERALSADDFDRISQALAPLAQADGLALGRGTRQGQGRLQLKAETLTSIYELIDPLTGLLVAQPDDALSARFQKRWSGAAASPAACSWQLRLTADGPFISIRDHEAERPDEPGKAMVAPLEHERRAVLRPSSLIGALRARAAWLAECARLRAAPDGQPADRFAPGRPLEHDLDDRDRVVRAAREVATLSSVERLFGVPGWRGELAVEGLCSVGPSDARQRWTSVCIDRFTGGGREQLLYTTETFLEPVFELRLCHRPRAQGLAEAARDADRELLELLIAELEANDLFLGHGAAKGFGWFEVERIVEEQTA